MSLRSRLRRLEGHAPEEHCRFAFVAIDMDGFVMNWPTYGEPEKHRRSLTAEAFRALRKEHEKTCPICRKLKAEGRYPPDVNFQPYDPTVDTDRQQEGIL